MSEEPKSRPFPLRFELPGGVKCLRVERIFTGGTRTPNYIQVNTNLAVTPGHWRCWLMANGDFSLGTFIQLLDNGGINRVTWHADGTEDVFVVKDGDQCVIQYSP